MNLIKTAPTAKLTASPVEDVGLVVIGIDEIT